ncbi:DNA-directed RNA polymerase subunit delta [Virgibacillus sp. W0181]|uniref:DNA-directed RNA polymerase subunit delta n=1 Tax=Virgibacillus sp. W0181 TaxID=3391581 RepID=UPI003F45629B
MSLEKYSHADTKEMSMIELANLILLDEKQAINFNDLFSKISELKGFTESDKGENIARFYTDLNVDGRFATLGSNVWGLKRWYPVNHVGDVVAPEPAPKKKKKKKAAKNTEADFDLEDPEDDLEDEDFDLEDEAFDEAYTDDYEEEEEDEDEDEV